MKNTNSIFTKDNYLNEKITEIGKMISDYKFIENADPETAFAIYKNPFLLMVAISSILGEENTKNTIKSTIGIVPSHLLNKNQNKNKAYNEVELYDDNILNIAYETLHSKMQNIEYSNINNKKVLEFFLDNIALCFIDKKTKKMKGNYEEIKVINILDAFSDNLEKKIGEINDELTKEDQEKAVDDLLKEYEEEQREIKEEKERKSQKLKIQKEKQTPKLKEQNKQEVGTNNTKGTINLKEDVSSEIQNNLNKNQFKKGKTPKFHLYNTVKKDKKTVTKTSNVTQIQEINSNILDLDSLSFGNRNERSDSQESRMTLMTTYTTTPLSEKVKNDYLNKNHKGYLEAADIINIRTKQAEGENYKYNMKFLDPRSKTNNNIQTDINTNEIDYLGLKNFAENSSNFILKSNIRNLNNTPTPNPTIENNSSQKLTLNNRGRNENNGRGGTGKR